MTIRFAAAVTLLGLFAMLSPAQAQSFSVTAQCAAPFMHYRAQVNALLDASLHGEAAYTKLRSEEFEAASGAALKACRADAQAKHAIYATNDQLSSYQATRDTALRLLQEAPPPRRD